MKLRIVLLSRILIALGLTLITGLSLYKLYSPELGVAEFVLREKIKRTRMRLLCKMDHHVLLEACRDLSKQMAAGKLSPGDYSIRHRQRPPEISGFPKCILDVEASDVVLHKDGHVTLEINFSRLGRFGVEAYPDDYEKPFTDFRYGDRELIPGLWYYDEGYVNNPNYDNMIKALIQKAG